MSVDSWNTNSALNTTLEGVNVDEGMLPGLLNDCLRKMAAAIKVFRVSAYCKDLNVTIAASGGAAPSGANVTDGHLWIEY